MANREPNEKRNALLAQMLREERIEAGLSMTEVAEQSGLSQQMVSYIERGMRKPTADSLWRIADVLGVDLWRILKAVDKDS